MKRQDSGSLSVRRMHAIEKSAVVGSEASDLRPGAGAVMAGIEFKNDCRRDGAPKWRVLWCEVYSHLLDIPKRDGYATDVSSHRGYFPTMAVYRRDFANCLLLW
jgi:hypothetical protein